MPLMIFLKYLQASSSGSLAALSIAVLGASHDIVEQLPLLDVLHDQEQVLGGFDDLHSSHSYLVQLDDVGVPNQLENVDLTGYSFDICHVNNPLLFEDLDGHFLLGEGVSAHLNLTEGSFADCLANHVVADLAGLRRRRYFYLRLS